MPVEGPRQRISRAGEGGTGQKQDASGSVLEHSRARQGFGTCTPLEYRWAASELGALGVLQVSASSWRLVWERGLTLSPGEIQKAPEGWHHAELVPGLARSLHI